MCCVQAVPVKSASQTEELLEQGLRSRSVAATLMNASSSRSHLVVTIHFQQVCFLHVLVPQFTFNRWDHWLGTEVFSHFQQVCCLSTGACLHSFSAGGLSEYRCLHSLTAGVLSEYRHLHSLSAGGLVWYGYHHKLSTGVAVHFQQ